MADNIADNQSQQAAVDAEQQNAQQYQLAPEVKEQMEMRLNGIMPKQPDAGNGEQKIEPQNSKQPAQNEPSTTVVDPFGVLKEKFGYNSAEDAMTEIEQLRKLKDAPLANEDFENELSLNIFRALQAGKKDVVYDYLSKETKIDGLLSKEITKDTAADYVKLGMQLKYPDLTEGEINFKFNKQFAIPAKPIQSVDEEPEAYQERLTQWQQTVNDKQMEMLIEAKFAKPEVEKFKSQLVFPEIYQDEGYAQYQKMLEQQAQSQEQQKKIDEEVKAAYKAMSPKNIETKLDFKDEANKIAFQFQYEPDAEGFAKAVEVASDIDKLWGLFYNQDGTPDRAKFLKFLYYGMNAEKAIMEAMKQSKNAAIKANIPDNSSNGLSRQTPQSMELSDIDKLMQLHGVSKR